MPSSQISYERHSRERACEKIGAFATNSVVMARLDRANHEKSNALTMLLDGRVKPGHDSGALTRFFHTLEGVERAKTSSTWYDIT